jgi:hypothetical protein
VKAQISMKMHKLSEASGPHWPRYWNSPATRTVHATKAIRILKYCVWHDTPITNRYSSRECAPLGQRGRASLLVNWAGDEMAFMIEVVVDLGVD